METETLNDLNKINIIGSFLGILTFIQNWVLNKMHENFKPRRKAKFLVNYLIVKLKVKGAGVDPFRGATGLIITNDYSFQVEEVGSDALFLVQMVLVILVARRVPGTSGADPSNGVSRIEDDCHALLTDDVAMKATVRTSSPATLPVTLCVRQDDDGPVHLDPDDPHQGNRHPDEPVTSSNNDIYCQSIPNQMVKKASNSIDISMQLRHFLLIIRLLLFSLPDVVRLQVSSILTMLAEMRKMLKYEVLRMPTVLRFYPAQNPLIQELVKSRQKPSTVIQIRCRLHVKSYYPTVAEKTLKLIKRNTSCIY